MLIEEGKSLKGFFQVSLRFVGSGKELIRKGELCRLLHNLLANIRLCTKTS